MECGGGLRWAEAPWPPLLLPPPPPPHTHLLQMPGRPRAAVIVPDHHPLHVADVGALDGKDVGLGTLKVVLQGRGIGEGGMGGKRGGAVRGLVMKEPSSLTANKFAWV